MESGSWKGVEVGRPGALDAWVNFVETRDRYHRLVTDPKADPAAVAAARETMQEAYLSWSSR